MSLLATHLRSILFSNLRPDMSSVQRKAAWNLFNSIDSDLDIAGYTNNESSTTQEAVERFESVLKHGEENMIEDEDDFDDIVDEPEDSPEPARTNIIDIDLDDDDDIT
jgi:hypothetical protein